jgi:hypothetical protein
MVNFHDPAVLATDLREYQTFLGFPGFNLTPVQCSPFGSDILEDLLYIGWSLHVGLHCALLRHHSLSLRLTSPRLLRVHNLISDGNFSLLLTMSGMSFEDMYATAGRYGCVFTCTTGPHRCLFWKCFSA